MINRRLNRQTDGAHRRRHLNYFALYRRLGTAEKRARLERALRDINAKYGDNTIRRGL